MSRNTLCTISRFPSGVTLFVIAVVAFLCVEGTHEEWPSCVSPLTISSALRPFALVEPGDLCLTFIKRNVLVKAAVLTRICRCNHNRYDSAVDSLNVVAIAMIAQILGIA